MSKTIRNVIIVGVVAAVIVAASFVALTSCDNNNLKAKTPKELLDIYAFSAVSGVSLLSDSFQDSAPVSVSEAVADNAETPIRPDGITDGDTERIKQYLGMFEGYILNNGVSAEATVPDENDGEYAAYQHKMSIVLPNAEGGNDSFIMYYNELTKVDKNAEKAAAEIGDKDDEEADSDNSAETETEIESGVEGVMIFKERAYPLIGEKELEVEGNESESELSIKVFLSETERDTYIDIKQEIENDEIEYVYSVFEKGQLLNRTSVEFENDAEENEQEIKLSFRDNSTDAKLKTWYKIEKNDGGGAMFSVKYKAADESIYKLDISVSDGIYTFIYRNGFTETV